MAPESNAHLTLDQLAAFDAGQLPPSGWTEVERHVARCDACCRLLEELPDDHLVQLIRIGRPPPAGEWPTPTGGSVETPTPSLETLIDVPPELGNHPRYRVIRALGAGGMGRVFLAEHRLMNRLVAIKVIQPWLTRSSTAVDRFRREVRAAARLSHPNIATAFDAEQAGDLHFLVTEFVEGSSLDQVLARQGPLSLSQACHVLREASLGLQHAFERGLVHRDIKPANLLLASRDLSENGFGRVKILDFGLARFASETASSADLTASGAVLGTPDYIAPEQAVDPRQADIRADLYSLSCTLYHLLAGSPPFPGSTPLQKLIAHRERLPPPLRELRADVPPKVLRLLNRMLAKDPAHRPQTPAEVVQEMASWEDQTASAGLAPERIACAGLSTPTLFRQFRSRTSIAVVVLLLMVVVVLASLSHLSSPFGDRRMEATSVGTPGPTTAASASASLHLMTNGLVETKRKAARDRAAGWLRANSRFGPDHAFVASQVRSINSYAAEGQGSVHVIGGGLLQSKRMTYLALRGGEFFSFDISAEQARPLQFTETGVMSWAVPEDCSRRLTSPMVLLSGPAVERGDMIDPKRLSTGSVNYRRLAEVTGPLVLRVTYYPDRTRAVDIIKIASRIDPADGTFSFSFGPFYSPVNRHVGPLLMFLEVCFRDDPSQPNDGIVVSNTAAIVVHVATSSQDSP